jgi:hypothetical protein
MSRDGWRLESFGAARGFGGLRLREAYWTKQMESLGSRAAMEHGVRGFSSSGAKRIYSVMRRAVHGEPDLVYHREAGDF